MEDMVYWIWLSISCTPGTGTFAKLISQFDSAKAVYDADEKAIARCVGYKTSDRSLLNNKDTEKAEQIYSFCVKNKVGLLTYNDELFPQSLREIDTPPVLLYYRGILPDFNRLFCVASVGTRSLSDYGRKNAFTICYDLASAGAVTVSGMAIGIDGVSMSGALSAGGKVIAVIGSGIDVCYPPQHLKLAREIVKNGCVLTEYPPKTPPSKHNFPIRNRLISGLSAATVVMEGRERSGSLITARYAKEQNRQVYALPGNVGSKTSEVTNLLMKNGAKPITSAEDVIRDFEQLYPGVLNPFKLKEKCPVNMMEALAAHGVCATTPSDDYFIPYGGRATKSKSEGNGQQASAVTYDAPSENVSDAPAQPTEAFDADAIGIYKKIPLNGACSIESLVDSKNDARSVMKLLLKLEMAKFIVILPGEMVARKSK